MVFENKKQRQEKAVKETWDAGWSAGWAAASRAAEGKLEAAQGKVDMLTDLLVKGSERADPCAVIHEVGFALREILYPVKGGESDNQIAVSEPQTVVYVPDIEKDPWMQMQVQEGLETVPTVGEITEEETDG